MANCSILSEDVEKDILLRLPVKSLVRFKCVQKSWYDLIESSDFIARHLKRVTSNVDNTFLLVKYDQQDRNNLFFLLTNDVVKDHIEINLPFHDTVEVLPPCINGIFCLFDRRHCSIALWNPALREFKVLPLNSVVFPSHLSPCQDNVGFGYDSRNDEYKVVRIIYLYDEHDDPPPWVETYSFKSGSWRKVETSMDVFILKYSQSEAYLNGAYHWWALDHSYEEAEPDIILAFDLSEEVFHKIQFPNPGPHTSGTWRSLAILNNCLGMICQHSHISEKTFDIWVMKEYKLEQSWTKLFSVGQFPRVKRALGFWKNEKLLFATNHDEGLILYDLRTQQIQIIKLLGKLNSVRALNYYESLVSVKDLV